MKIWPHRVHARHPTRNFCVESPNQQMKFSKRPRHHYHRQHSPKKKKKKKNSETRVVSSTTPRRRNPLWPDHVDPLVMHRPSLCLIVRGITQHTRLLKTLSLSLLSAELERHVEREIFSARHSRSRKLFFCIARDIDIFYFLETCVFCPFPFCLLSPILKSK